MDTATTQLRKPSFRQRQAVELYLGANGRKSQAEVLREAGYSESIARHPGKIFGGNAVLQLMEEMGVNEKLGVEVLKRGTDAIIPVHFTFPIFQEDDGEQFTDQDIREYLEGANIVVAKIVHGHTTRHAFCYAQNNKTQLQSAHMIFKLLGSYAPKKVISKNDRRVGVFSMKELRQEMEKAKIQIADEITQ